jgi:hypothetical protein
MNKYKGGLVAGELNLSGFKVAHISKAKIVLVNAKGKRC